MGRKCDAGVIKNLTLRGQTYYYRMDFKTGDGRRRAFRRSLHTSDFCSAVALVKRIRNKGLDMDAKLKLATEILSKIPATNPDMTLAEVIQIEKQQREAREAAARILGGPSTQLVFTPEQAHRAIYGPPVSDAPTVAPANSAMTSPIPSVTQVVSVPPTAVNTVPDYTIAEMIDIFCLKTQKNSKKHIKVVGQRLYEMVRMANVSPEDDFGKLLAHDVIKKIVASVLAKRVNNDTKKTTLGRFKRLANFAIDLCGDKYEKRALMQIPDLPKTPKAKKIQYQPFSIQELRAIFSIECDFFDHNPDIFWGCCLGLFTGSRITAAFTLMAHNIKMIEDIPCIEIIKDHPFKELKTEDSERVVPFHPQLLELGFWEHVEERKKQFGAEEEDFLFPVIKTKNGTKNDHIMRIFNRLLESAKIKTFDKLGRCGRTGKSFHSFRDTMSVTMLESKIPETQINKVGGWKGEGTVAEYYSKHALTSIQAVMQQYNYDEIMPQLRYWAERLRGKFGCEQKRLRPKKA